MAKYNIELHITAGEFLDELSIARMLEGLADCVEDDYFFLPVTDDGGNICGQLLISKIAEG